MKLGIDETVRCIAQNQDMKSCTLLYTDCSYAEGVWRAVFVRGKSVAMNRITDHRQVGCNVLCIYIISLKQIFRTR